MSQPSAIDDRRRFRRLEDAFELALDGATEDRRRLLDGLRDEDPELAQEVEELLAAEADAAGVFTDGPWQRELWSRDVEPELPEPGDRLGAYRIERALGCGGMGQVFLARRDDGAFDGQVAIKWLDTTRRAPGAVLRFCLERRILAQLDHPHVARLLDAGATPSGVPFLVMEYVAGLPIDQHCRISEASPRRRIELFLQLCSAVAHAHRKGLVHRDLKPANVLVATGGDTGTDDGVKLLDFGIARPIDPRRSALESAETGPGERWLSLAWASPEQLRGQDVDYRSDVYSLGVLLFTLLAGESPYGLRHLTASEIERAVRTADSSGSVFADANLGADHLAIVRKAMAFDPADRYACVEALASDLRRHLDHRPVEARQGGWTYRTGRFVRRHRASVAAAGAALALALGWASHAMDQHRRLVLERDHAVQVTQSFLETFEQPIADHGVAAELRATELLELGFGRLEPQLGDRPEPVQTRLLGAYASAFRGLQRPQRALELADQALAVGPGAGPEDAHETWLRIVRSHALFDLGRLDEGAESSHLALAWLRDHDDFPSLLVHGLVAVARGVALRSGGAAAEVYLAEAVAVSADLQAPIRVIIRPRSAAFVIPGTPYSGRR